MNNVFQYLCDCLTWMWLPAPSRLDPIEHVNLNLCVTITWVYSILSPAALNQSDTTTGNNVASYRCILAVSQLVDFMAFVLLCYTLARHWHINGFLTRLHQEASTQDLFCCRAFVEFTVSLQRCYREVEKFSVPLFHNYYFFPTVATA